MSKKLGRMDENRSVMLSGHTQGRWQEPRNPKTADHMTNFKLDFTYQHSVVPTGLWGPGSDGKTMTMNKVGRPYLMTRPLDQVLAKRVI